MLRLRQLGKDLVTDDAQGYGSVVQAGDNEITVAGRTLKRVTLDKPAPASDSFRRLIGEYGWDHDKLYVFEKDGKLSTLIEWFEFDTLEQKSDASFAFPRSGLYDGEQAIFNFAPSGEPASVKVSGVVFERRPLGAGKDGVFRIQPQKPIAELRKEALAAKPPAETGDFLQSDLVELTGIDPTIKLDVRYAGANNFLSTPLYTQARAFMQRPAAEAVARINRKLREKGYGLVIHDAYRPWYVTKMFWDATPQEGRIFVANPAEGSRHNRGCAVDLSLYDLATGQEIEMTGVYDEMSQRSYAYYPGGTSLQRWHRDLLRHAMESDGFTVYPWEWWHFDFNDWRRYPIGNETFEQLSGKKPAAALHHPQPNQAAN
jgi:D-alanyl-D-alanine dipeptidase